MPTPKPGDWIKVKVDGKIFDGLVWKIDGHVMHVHVHGIASGAVSMTFSLKNST